MSRARLLVCHSKSEVLTASPDNGCTALERKCVAVCFILDAHKSRRVSFARLVQNVPTLAVLQHKRMVVRSYVFFPSTEMALRSLAVEHAHVQRPACSRKPPCPRRLPQVLENYVVAVTGQYILVLL